jgi:hypothetical protein
VKVELQPDGDVVCRLESREARDLLYGLGDALARLREGLSVALDEYEGDENE